MSVPNRSIRSERHAAENQPPPFENVDRFGGDRALGWLVERAGGGVHAARLSAFGRQVGSSEMLEAGSRANRQVPELQTHDRYGQRLDEVIFHPDYHRLMRLGLEAGIASEPWRGAPGGHVLHAALMMIMQAADSGTTCPMSMTYAAVPALIEEPAVAAEWTPRILAGCYDPASRPASEKAGVTVGMAMTEKQGGSDVRSGSTSAEPISEPGWYSLTGHKWFCSAPMSDAFLTLAQAPGGLTCFLAPRWLESGARNAGFRLVRLKDKLGDRSNASCEIEYCGALARRIGQEGRGIATIIRMVQHTRLDCAAGSAGVMRAALAEAMWHTAHRRAFGATLAQQPLMRRVLAELAVDAEAATAVTLRVALALDRGEPLARVLTPLAKFWVCKQAPNFVAETMECLGGAGYVETFAMARLFRQAPLNAIWEGSGNVIALDVLRALAREPESMQALMALLDGARRLDARLDALIEDLQAPTTEPAAARRVVDQMATAAAAAILLQWGSPVAEAFVALRIGQPTRMFGAGAGALDTGSILERAMPDGVA